MITSTLPITTSTAEGGVTTTSMTTSSTSIRVTTGQNSVTTTKMTTGSTSIRVTTGQNSVTTTKMTTGSTSIRETRRQKAEAYLEDLIRNYTSSPRQEAPSEPPTAEAKNAETIGSIGIIFMALFLSLFVVLDIVSLGIYLEPMRENFRQLKELITK